MLIISQRISTFGHCYISSSILNDPKFGAIHFEQKPLFQSFMVTDVSENRRPLDAFGSSIWKFHEFSSLSSLMSPSVPKLCRHVHNWFHGRMLVRTGPELMAKTWRNGSNMG